jgi:hypothetical protein
MNETQEKNIEAHPSGKKPKRTYQKKELIENDRDWEFEFGKNPPKMDDMVSYIRYIFEGRFKGVSILDVFIFCLLCWLLGIIIYKIFFS